MHIFRLQPKRYVLRVYKLSFIVEAITGLLFSAGGREDLRPQLPRVRQSLGIMRSCFARLKSQRIARIEE